MSNGTDSVSEDWICHEYMDDTIYKLKPATSKYKLWHSYVTTPVMKTFRQGTKLIHKVLMTTPAKSLHHMTQKSSFNVIWDTGAFISISLCKEDFIRM